jgi:hypothetical protein
VPRFTLWVPTIKRAGGLLLITALYFHYQYAAYWGLVPLLEFPV